MPNEVFNLNTPIQKVEFSGFGTEVEVFVKRDDMIHPFVSGNKWRKLKYNILEALESGKNTVRTYGGAYSNHLIATAVACAAYGLKSEGIVRGDELKETSNYVLRLCHEFGMELKFVSRSEYNLQEKNPDPDVLVIPEGGANENGIRGCEEILNGVSGFDRVMVAVGTGTTLRGIARSSIGNTKIHGFAAMGNGEYLRAEIPEWDNSKNFLETRFSFGGFGKFDLEQLQFNRSFASETGILLDPVYTGKMFRGVSILIEAGEILPHERVLLIHTGGMTGVLSDKWLKSV
ncbi:MAG: pyridoxal-phosphate dependent enzyme [Bacteroidetes bacterium]|nr:pyridoxal-phosphate dependent enzyme [Bacteroidota bacterium]